MKRDSKANEDFHAVEFFRTVKEKLAAELGGKTFEQQQDIIRQYLSGKRKFPPVQQTKKAA